MKKYLKGAKLLTILATMIFFIVSVGKMNPVSAAEPGSEEYDKNNVVINHSGQDIVFQEGYPAIVTDSKGLNGYSIGTNSFYTLDAVSWSNTANSMVYGSEDHLVKGYVTVRIALKTIDPSKKYSDCPSKINITYNGETSEWSQVQYTKAYIRKFTVSDKDCIDINNSKYFTFPNGDEMPYTGRSVRLPVRINIDGKELKEGTDYEVLYKNNILEGTASVTYTGINDYSGSYTKYFTISKKAISVKLANIAVISDQTYTGNAIEPAVTVTFDNFLIYKGTDYTVSYSNNINAGIATVTITGIGNYDDTVTTTFKILHADISKANFSTISAQNYTRKAITPAFSMAYNGKALTKNVDYSFTYSNNINPGNGIINVTGKGNYTGNKTIYFKINAPKVGFTFSVKGYKYKITKAGQVSIIGAEKKNLSKIAIADNVKFLGKSYKITGIEKNAFKGFSKATTLTIGKNVKKIGANAFSGCKKLSKVTIKSATISSFGANSFKGTGKKISFKVPKSALKKYTAKIRKTGVSKKSVISK